MTDYEFWSLVIQIVGFATVAFSLVFLALQTRQVVKQTQIIVYDSVASGMSALDGIFVASPEMIPYFYEGQPIARNDPNYYKAMAIAIALTDFLESCVVQRVHPRDTPWWDSYIDDQFALSPILCEYLEAKRHWYDPRVYAAFMAWKRRAGTTSPSSAAVGHAASTSAQASNAQLPSPPTRP